MTVVVIGMALKALLAESLLEGLVSTVLLVSRLLPLQLLLRWALPAAALRHQWLLRLGVPGWRRRGRSSPAVLQWSAQPRFQRCLL